MTQTLATCYGNPSGAHRLAREANRVLDESRATLGSVFGVEPGNIVFTSGGTEADTLAILSVLQDGGLGMCSAIEHHAVLEPIEHAGGVVLPVLENGTLDLRALEVALLEHQDAPVLFVSVMTVNNESGVIQPISEASELVRRLAPDAVFHTDAVQAPAWLDLAQIAPHVDLMSVTAHKFGGPKGVGFLAVTSDLDVEPVQRGGGQERGRRGGTQNVAGVAAMAAAGSALAERRAHCVPRVRELRDRLVQEIRAEVPDVVESGVIDGDRSHKTPHVAHLCFDGIESEALLFLLEKADVMASAAASCSSGAAQPSHVLAAMGVSRSMAAGSLRLSLGYESTDADVDAAVDAVVGGVQRLRNQEW